MILSLLLFFGVALLLSFEGKLLLRLVARNQLTRWEQWALGFPLSAFLNALLFFVLTIVGVPLTFLVVYGAHALIIVLLAFFSRKISLPAQFPITNSQSPSNFQFLIFNSQFPRKFLIALLLLSLTVKLFYAFSHAVFLPSYYFDTVSQWNMRARISYEDHAIAFDTDESRGMSKPQYPILLHALQIAFMLPQAGWLDRVANSATFLLTLTSFVTLFLLLMRLGNFLFALLTVALLFMVPLFSIHAGQGYGDIHVVEYLLLSAVFLFFSLEGTNNQKLETKNLLLSALFVAASAWVKQEGVFFGVIPWLVLLSLWCWRGRDLLRRCLLRGFLPAACLGFLWTLFIFTQGFPIGAHGGDFQPEWHGEGISKVLTVLFSFGSFGMFFYVLPVALCVLMCATFRNPIILWGLFSFVETLFVFLFTSNYQYLMNHLTFHRTMLIPLSILVLGCAFLFERLLNKSER